MPTAASPGEAVFVFVLAAVAAVAAVVWAGATLAAMTVGAGAPGGLVDAIRAIPDLGRGTFSGSRKRSVASRHPSEETSP